MNIPNAYLRKSYINALPQYKIYDIAVPSDEVTPELYITVNNILLNEHEEYKSGREWLCAMSLNVWQVNEKGFNSTISLEEVADDIIHCDLVVDGWRIKSRKMFDCKQFEPIETDSQTIQRLVVTEKIWLWKDA